MTEQHPITPPPELVEQWANDSVSMKANAIGKDWEIAFASRAAQWGADQELEACCQWIPKYLPWDVDQLRAARRPNPPSLKEQALKELRQLPIDPELGVCASALDTIRRALEALDD
jgi:hypothetical protein